MTKRPPAPVFRSAVRLKRFIAESGGRDVVLANGCFDPLHVGHIRYLADARECGGFLVVAINDDRSTRMLKGAGRPITRAGGRARIVAELESVDAVLIFGARDVRRVLHTVRPRFHAKGTDYTVDTVPERDMSKALGIETVIVGDPKSHASRTVVGRIRGRENGGVS